MRTACGKAKVAESEIGMYSFIYFLRERNEIQIQYITGLAKAMFSTRILMKASRKPTWLKTKGYALPCVSCASYPSIID